MPSLRTGSSAGVDFHIGEIVDNQYSWEIIRYQGQDPENPLGDNFFSITYNYMENLYGVSYAMNLPEGSVLYGNPPIDIARYLPGAMVSVQGGNGMTADGWQFVGWALDAGNGVYTAGEKLYSDVSVHGIPVETQASMKTAGWYYMDAGFRCIRSIMTAIQIQAAHFRRMFRVPSERAVIFIIPAMKLR